MTDKIVVLDDSRQYCILNELIYGGKRYCCGVEYFEDKEELSDDYVVFEEDLSGGSLALVTLDDEVLEEYLLLKFAELD